MGSQGTTKGTKRNMSGRWKNPSDFSLDSMRSYQDLTFSIKIKDGIPRDNQMDKKENVWQVETNLATFYWILWGRVRTSLFPSGSRMGPQGTTKGTSMKISGRWKNPIDFYLILWVRIRTSLFPSGSRIWLQRATKWTKRKTSGRWKNPSDFLLDFMWSYQDLAFSIRIQDGVSRDSQRDKNENVWQVEKP